LRPFLRNNYTPLLLLRTRRRRDAFALRLLLSHRTRRTFSLRCAGCALCSSLLVLLTSLFLLDATLFALHNCSVTLRLSLLSLLRRSNGLCRLR
jgi:hypothetical protein